jgi:hypothetical protein
MCIHWTAQVVVAIQLCLLLVHHVMGVPGMVLRSCRDAFAVEMGGGAAVDFFLA